MNIFIEIILFFLFCNHILSEELFSKEQCLHHPLLKNLEISTTLNENSNKYNIKIFSNCEILENWEVKTKSIPLCENNKRVFESGYNPRRPIRFYFKSNPLLTKNEKLTIQSISLSNSQNMAITNISKTSFSLYQDDYIDIYIQYECLKKSKSWYKVLLNILIEDYKNPITFEYYKICNGDFSGSFDLSHLLILILVFGVIYTSFMPNLKSNIEHIIITEFHEIRNPENLTIIVIVLIIILSTMYFINWLHNWIVICLIFIIPLTTEMVIEGLHRGTSIEKQLSNQYSLVPYIGKISYDYAVCFLIGILLMLIWFVSHNWIINDLVVICICIVSIRIFRFTNSKFIISIYVLILLYEMIWVNNYSKKEIENKLTNNSKSSVPLRLICPELVSTPFKRCFSVPISDIILPGIFLAYLKKFDEHFKIKNSELTYFTIGLYSLGGGLTMNLIFYYIYSRPTPSFLYTGIIMLGVTLYFAYSNTHLDDFLFGFKSTGLRKNIEKNNINLISQSLHSESENNEFFLKNEEFILPKKEGKNVEMSEYNKKD